ncbi:hypothetical protein HDV57DRAFT_12117 [Trichoderma longibrachiatum]|uniref:Rhodanese domain-containing protein n=1 Tax=Trichoderma longibrachiatum ATCC 18648 TaxID=983965 RepID=A0A2T4CJD3_TRILO|nr:hypothetical protein M440DRAFT_1020270 [Trichoderma longibrachiatum ATCC 18648]
MSDSAGDGRPGNQTATKRRGEGIETFLVRYTRGFLGVNNKLERLSKRKEACYGKEGRTMHGVSLRWQSPWRWALLRYMVVILSLFLLTESGKRRRKKRGVIFEADIISWFLSKTLFIDLEGGWFRYAAYGGEVCRWDDLLRRGCDGFENKVNAPMLIMGKLSPIAAL